MTTNQAYLIHHGIKGQKWGIRKYQNEDGSLTEEGRRRYGGDTKKLEKFEKKISKISKYENKAANAKTGLGREINAIKAMSARNSVDRYGRKIQDKKYTDNSRNGFVNALFKVNEKGEAHGNAAETRANIAKLMKERSEKETNMKKANKIMNKAVEQFAYAENHERYAEVFKSTANQKKVIRKAITYLGKMHDASIHKYTSSGRYMGAGDALLESISDVGLSVISGVNLSGAAGAVRDKKYKKTYTAQERWDRINSGAERRERNR